MEMTMQAAKRGAARWPVRGRRCSVGQLAARQQRLASRELGSASVVQNSLDASGVARDGAGSSESTGNVKSGKFGDAEHEGAAPTSGCGRCGKRNGEDAATESSESWSLDAQLQLHLSNRLERIKSSCLVVLVVGPKPQREENRSKKSPAPEAEAAAARRCWVVLGSAALATKAASSRSGGVILGGLRACFARVPGPSRNSQHQP